MKQANGLPAYLEDLNVKAIQDNTLLMDLLALNAEQLTYFLEDYVLDNPFIHLNYPLENNSRGLKVKALDKQIAMIQPSQTLESYLYEQILLYRQTPIRNLMLELVPLLDKDGFLPYTIDQLSQDLGADNYLVMDAVTLLQNLEPVGVGAYDLKEALMLQTEQDSNAPEPAYYLLEVFFEELRAKDYAKINQESPFSEAEISQCVKYYAGLYRSPAQLFSADEGQEAVPDLAAKLVDGQLKINYLAKNHVLVSFKQDYFDRMAQEEDLEVKSYIENKAAEYDYLQVTLQLRQEILVMVATHLIEGQGAYLQNIDRRHSLSMRQLMTLTGFSEPLLYRILNHKHLEFEGRIFRLADFITVAATKGRDSRTFDSIKDRMVEIIQSSDQSLTDDQVVSALAAEDIYISKAIVANYRKSL